MTTLIVLFVLVMAAAILGHIDRAAKARRKQEREEDQ